MVMIGILIAPLVETLLFQTLVYFVLSRINLFNQRKILIIIVSAILFAVEHIYSVQYMIYTFVMGAFLMYAYIISKGKNPFLRVFLIHLMINSIAFLLDILTDWIKRNWWDLSYQLRFIICRNSLWDVWFIWFTGFMIQFYNIDRRSTNKYYYEEYPYTRYSSAYISYLVFPIYYWDCQSVRAILYLLYLKIMAYGNRACQLYLLVPYSKKYPIACDYPLRKEMLQSGSVCFALHI